MARVKKYSRVTRNFTPPRWPIEVKIEENKLTGKFDYDGAPLGIKGVFEGEKFSGQITAGYDGFPMTATRTKSL